MKGVRRVKLKLSTKILSIRVIRVPIVMKLGHYRYLDTNFSALICFLLRRSFHRPDHYSAFLKYFASKSLTIDHSPLTARDGMRHFSTSCNLSIKPVVI